MAWRPVVTMERIKINPKDLEPFIKKHRFRWIENPKWKGPRWFGFWIHWRGHHYNVYWYWPYGEEVLQQMRMKR